MIYKGNDSYSNGLIDLYAINQWRLVGKFTGGACYGSIKSDFFLCLELEIEQFT